MTETGPYQFRLWHVAVTPETAAGNLTASETVTTEAVDSLGDVDEFTVSASAGQELIATVTSPLWLDALEPGTPDTLRTGRTGATGVVVVPPSGQFRLRTYEPRLLVSADRVTSVFHFTGPYTLQVRPLNRAPETLPSAVTRGAHVVGESIDYFGDVDEFSFDAVAGDTASVTLDNFQSFGEMRLLLDLLSPTGTVLASTNTVSGSPNTTPTVTLPVTGSYLIRVRNSNDQAGTGVYDFTVH